MVCIQAVQRPPIMSPGVASIQCPKCGSSDSTNELPDRFGYRWQCGHCGTTSVLIADRKLYTPRPGDRVCAKCGLVGSSKARYCQCGSLLVQSCRAGCAEEFSITHALCDNCGWPVNLDPLSQEGKSEIAKRAICSIDLSDFESVQNALSLLITLGQCRPECVPILIAVMEKFDSLLDQCFELIATHGEFSGQAIPILLNVYSDKLASGASNASIVRWCEAIGSIGPAASVAKPTLVELLSHETIPLRGACRALDRIGCAEAALPILEKVIWRAETPESATEAFLALESLGRRALPTLSRFGNLWMRITRDWRTETARLTRARIESL